MIDPTPNTIDFSTTTRDAKYELIETKIQGGKLYVYFMATSLEYSGPMNLIRSSFITDKNGEQYQPTDMFHGNKHNNGDYHQVDLTKGVPTKFGLAFDTTPSSTFSVQINIVSSEPVIFRNVPIPFQTGTL